jgi:hypothetical protein
MHTSQFSLSKTLLSPKNTFVTINTPLYIYIKKGTNHTQQKVIIQNETNNRQISFIRFQSTKNSNLNKQNIIITRETIDHEVL